VIPAALSRGRQWQVYVGATARHLGDVARPRLHEWSRYLCRQTEQQWRVAVHTFLGENGDDYGNAIAVDGSGNVYIGGDSTASWGSPVHDYTSSGDAFAAKLNSNGALQWHTFLGGNDGDYSNAIAVDGSGKVYVGGYSYATWGTPIRPYASDSDAFAAKLNSSGALQWHAFLGGNRSDKGNAIAWAEVQHLCGGHQPRHLGSPVHAYTNGYDAFAVKINSYTCYLPIIFKNATP